MNITSRQGECLGEQCPNFDAEFTSNLYAMGEHAAESAGFNTVDRCIEVASCVLQTEVSKEAQNA